MTKTGKRPCSLVGVFAFGAMLMATTPVAAELPVSVLFEGSDVAAFAEPGRLTQVARAGSADVLEAPATRTPRQAERVADDEIHLP